MKSLSVLITYSGLDVIKRCGQSWSSLHTHCIRNTLRSWIFRFISADIWPCTLINRRRRMSWSCGRARCTAWWRSVRTAGSKAHRCAPERLEFSQETTSHPSPGERYSNNPEMMQHQWGGLRFSALTIKDVKNTPASAHNSDFFPQNCEFLRLMIFILLYNV